MVAKELEDIAALLRSERTHIEKYGRILDETSSGLSNRSLLSQDLLQKIAGAMSAATSSTLDHNRHISSTLSEKTAELESVKSKLEEYKRLADTDPLTQIRNRRAFDKEITRIYSSNRGADVVVQQIEERHIDRAALKRDVEHLRARYYGHPVGDRIIQIIAEIFQSSIRADMFVARTGGEEFALIVEGASEDATYQIAERIRVLIEQTPFTSSQTGTNYGTVTVSMGICMASEADGPEDLYTKADRALYRSKVSGRNRVTRHSIMAGRAGKGWLLYKKD